MGIEGERIGMPEPAAERLPVAAKMARRHIDKGWRAGTTIQEFIAAANREIDIASGKVQRHHPGRMRQIPDHQRPCIMRGARQPGHVVNAAIAVIHMRQHQHRHIIIQKIGDRRLAIGMDKLVIAAGLPDHPFGDIVVGREIARLGDDLLAPRAQRQRRRQNLEQIDRRAVGDNDIVRGWHR